MTHVHLIADDLTGALDAAIAFLRPGDPLPVYWDGVPPALPSGSLAVDSGTRGAGDGVARRTVAGLVSALPPAPTALLYAKLDSLLRGHAAAEIAGWIDALAPDRCLIAPAFPHHGRITRGGIQYLRGPDTDVPVGTALAADLRQLGFEPQLCRPGDAIPGGISLWDADSDADLAMLVAAARGIEGRTLWCGSGGLALALADHTPPAPVRAADLPRPILGLFGTDHPVTRAQIAACGTAAVAVPDGSAASARRLAIPLAAHGAVLAGLDLPDGMPRAAAAARIAHELARLVGHMETPGTLVVSGGETLRGLCAALAVEHLDLYGQIETGVPCSVLRGGRFDRVHVVSKSGAFGDAGLLRRLMLSSQGDHP